MRLAIVDDDRSITSLFRHFVERHLPDCQVVEYNSSSLFNKDIEGGYQFDYAVLDLNFYGDVPGFVCMDRLKKFNPSCKIILLTSGISELEEQESIIDNIQIEVYMIKRKPLLPTELRKILSELVA